MLTRLAHSNSVDPWYNLALEEYLLRHVGADEVILYLWQNDHTVVIGKHQNAWKECRCQQLEADGGRIARRLSGGGAVYHDLGNLNFTFVMDSRLYDLERQLRVLLQAVRGLGLAAEFSGRNDLTVQGRKFSGNAFHFQGSSAYHHGTLLVATDFHKMTRYLQVSREKIVSKGIEADSVQSRVVNLSSLKPGLTVTGVAESLKQSFTAVYGDFTGEVRFDPSDPEIDLLHHQYASWEWCYGETPEFDIVCSHRFPWGGIELGLSVAEGRITNAVIYSDAMDTVLIESCAAALRGLPLHQDRLYGGMAVVATTGERKAYVDDLSAWLLSTGLFSSP